MVKHFKIFGSKCYIKTNDNNLGKFDSRSNEGIFLRYATRSEAYMWYNLILNKIISDVKVDEEFKYIRIEDDDDQPIFEQST